MTPLDDLFSTDESRAESQFEKVVTLNPAEISDFPNHPFKVKQDAKPNLCQAANAASHGTSYVVLDPKGEMLRDTGYLLAQRGYDVRVLDLLNMEKSHCYNPFVYLRDDNDVQRLVTNLFKSTTPKGSQSNDPFWDTAASMLLLALVFYLKYEAPPDEQNFSMVMEMLRAADVREDIDECGYCRRRNPTHKNCLLSSCGMGNVRKGLP